MFEAPIDDLVCKDHPYRKLLRIMNFERLCASLKVLFCENKGRKGYHFESGFKTLMLQRMPYERVFSKQSKKGRYIGIAKNQFQGFMQTLVHNFKRLISIHDTVLQGF